MSPTLGTLWLSHCKQCASKNGTDLGGKRVTGGGIPKTDGKIEEGTASREGEAVVLLNGLGRVGGQVAQKVFDDLALLLLAHGRFH